MAEAFLDIVIRAQNEARRTFDNIRGNVERLRRELNQVNRSNIDRVVRNLRDAARQGNTFRERLANVGRELRRIGREGLARLRQGLRAATERLQRLGQAAQRTRQQFQGVAEAGAKIAAVGAAPAFFSAAAIRSAARFSVQIAEIGTLVDDTVQSNDQLRESVLRVSSELGADRGQVAAAFYQIISAAGQEAARSTEFLETTVKAAQGGITDAGTAAQAIAGIINAYGLEVDDAGEVSDRLFTIVRGGITDFGKISRSIGQVTAVAANAGVGLDELSAALTTITAQGVRTSTAVAGIRALLVGLSREAARPVFELLGQSSLEAALEAEGLAGVIQAVTEVTGGATGEILKLVGSTEALAAVQNLSGRAAATFARELENQQNVAGATDAAFQEVADTLGKRLEQALDRISNAFVQIGGALGEAIIPVIEAVGEIAEGVRNWVRENESLAAAIGVTVTALAGLAVGLGAILGTIGLLGVAFSSGIATLASFVGAFRAGGAAITAFGAALRGLKLVLFTKEILALALAFGAALEILKLIKAIQEYNKVQAEAEERAREYREELEALEEQGPPTYEALAREVQNVTNLTEEQTEALRDQLRLLLQVTNARLRNALVAGDDAAIAVARAERDAARDLVGTFLDQTRAREEANQATLEAAELQANLTAAFRETEETLATLFDRQQETASIKYDAAVAEANKLFAANRAVLEIQEDLPGLQEAFRRNYRVLTALAENNAREQIAIAQRELRTRIELIPLQERATVEGQERILQLTREFEARRLDIQRQNIQRVESLRQQAFNRLQSLEQRAADISRRIVEEQQRGEIRLRELRRQGLSDLEAFEDRRREIRQLTSEFNRALARGDFEEAERLAQRQISLAGQLVGEIKEGEDVIVSREESVQAAVRETESAQQRVVRALAAQRRETLESRDAQRQLLQNLERTLDRLAATLERFQEPLELPFEVVTPDSARVLSELEAVQFAAQERPVGLAIIPSLDEDLVRSEIFDAQRQLEGPDAEINAIIRATSSPQEFLEELEDLRGTLADAGVPVDLIPNDELIDAVRGRLAREAIQTNVEFIPQTEETEEAINALLLPTDSVHEVIPDTDQADAAIENLERDTFSTHFVRVVERRAGGGVVGEFTRRLFSGGGKVAGPGTSTSDSVPAMLSRGEFVVKAAAVRRYGANFLSKLNNMAVPRLQGGGFPTIPSFRPDAGVEAQAAGSGVTDRIALDLTLGGMGPFSLEGERDTVNNLIDALAESSRGLARR